MGCLYDTNVKVAIAFSSGPLHHPAGGSHRKLLTLICRSLQVLLVDCLKSREYILALGESFKENFT